MKKDERDALLTRLDERSEHTKSSIARIWKAIVGLYAIWGSIIVGSAVQALCRR